MFILFLIASSTIQISFEVISTLFPSFFQFFSVNQKRKIKMTQKSSKNVPSQMLGWVLNAPLNFTEQFTRIDLFQTLLTLLSVLVWQNFTLYQKKKMYHILPESRDDSSPVNTKKSITITLITIVAFFYFCIIICLFIYYILFIYYLFVYLLYSHIFSVIFRLQSKLNLQFEI